jgi:hypothetical protein
MKKDDLEKLFDELVAFQKEKVLKFGRKIVPNLTSDDVLQPNDFQELENHPLFRYEEGVLEGLLTAQMSYLSIRNEKRI